MRWAAELRGVREVSLSGRADAEYWRRRMAPIGIAPALEDGHARVLVVAADGRFRGIRFQELSVSVLAYVDVDGVEHSGCFLVEAFNSVRLFALVERAVFKTPYRFGRVSVSVEPPRGFELRGAGTGALRATAREPTDPDVGFQVVPDEADWSGPVVLPAEPGQPRRLFWARLVGSAATFPFDPTRDTFELEPPPGANPQGAPRSLLDSRFQALRWTIRSHGSHAKSKTYPR